MTRRYQTIRELHEENEREIESAMAEAKNKGGRPQRIPGHKLQRLTVNLGPDHMTAVHDIADMRGTSMSQAVEWALGIAAATITKQQWKALEMIRAARQA